MRTARVIVAALAAGLGGVAADAQAGAHPAHVSAHAAAWRGGHGGHHHPWRGFGLGFGIGVASGWYWGWPYHDWAYYDPPPVVYAPPPPPGVPVVLPPPLPEPIYYPRSGQSDVQRETDLRECNRWATTQPAAMAEASAFQRAVLACMDGRGYSGR